MTRKTKTILIFLILLFISGPIVLFYFGKMRQTKSRRYFHRMQACLELKELSTKYFARTEDKIEYDRDCDFITFLSNENQGFTNEQLQELYRTPYDVNFYLFMPTKTDSSSLVLIAYSNPFEDRDGKFRCATFFYFKNNVNLVMLPQKPLKEIVGNEEYKSKKPNLFFCWHRPSYLNRQKYLKRIKKKNLERNNL